jgi:hypothetical protein
VLFVGVSVGSSGVVHPQRRLPSQPHTLLSKLGLKSRESLVLESKSVLEAAQSAAKHPWFKSSSVSPSTLIAAGLSENSHGLGVSVAGVGARDISMLQ